MARAAESTTATRRPARSTPWSQRGAGEIVAPHDVGAGRPVELPDGGDDGAGPERVAIVESEVPSGAALVELGGGDARTEPEVGADPAVRGQSAQVGQDLLPRREATAPAGRPERERVQVRRHVAGEARVGIVAPGPPEVVASVDDEEVLDAGLLERRGHADSPEPGAGHDYPVRRLLGHGPSLALCATRATKLSGAPESVKNPARAG